MELKFGRTRLFLGLKFGAALTCSHVRYLQSLRPSSARFDFSISRLLSTSSAGFAALP
ncbi:hypothetical protein Sjap_004753 [Stephania japonica]|uniref:Uncharacterized protein n=1 Tax=Stephania japonica TaxID=461633 RepID=A0AAP0PKI5_9MAGN